MVYPCLVSNGHYGASVPFELACIGHADDVSRFMRCLCRKDLGKQQYSVLPGAMISFAMGSWPGLK